LIGWLEIVESGGGAGRKDAETSAESDTTDIDMQSAK
jgi:hypothetical protein